MDIPHNNSLFCTCGLDFSNFITFLETYCPHLQHSSALSIYTKVIPKYQYISNKLNGIVSYPSILKMVTIGTGESPPHYKASHLHSH